ncbi:MAG: RpiB/LacA/LacB family sugar-phosphate isomerase [Saprospiraceae bacterium]|nr:RpiB/LacA/LacB family sugar-phosphate isomerase [Pyrinomonadaceae bacterium]
MSSVSKETREKVRELVRDVLRNTPVEAEQASPKWPEHVIVNSLQEKKNREFDRDESAKSLITENDLRGLEAGAKVRVADNARLTPLAQDIVSEKRIELIRKGSRTPSISAKSLAIGSDHGGYALKEELKVFLVGLGVNIRDLGTNSTDPVDYPDFALAVATAVGNKQVDLGIVIDGAGIGSAMTANKIPGVRAAACYSATLAQNAREHNGANVLSLGSGQNSFDEIKEIAKAFLTSELTEDRHKKRVGKIDEIERRYKK